MRGGTGNHPLERETHFSRLVRFTTLMQPCRMGVPWQLVGLPAWVDLGAHLTDSALERAETIVQSLITVATTWSGGIRWRQSGPACVVADGRVVPDSRRHDAFRGYVDNLGINITSDELNDQARPLAEAMAETHLPPELEESLRLLAEAGSEDSRETHFGSTKQALLP